MRYGFVIDHRKCIGCHACTTACKSENQVPVGVFRTWVKYIEKGTFPNTRRHFLVQRCNHCDNAPCVAICPTSALYRRSDGIVDFDNARCIGCKSCLQACPYDALYLDPATHTAAKCNFCAHRIELNLQPACVVVCPEQAIVAGDVDDPSSQIARLLGREEAQVRRPEQGTRPKLWYLGADEAALTPETTPVPPTYLWAETGLAAPTGLGPAADSADRNGRGDSTGALVVYNVQHPRPWGFLVSLYLWTKSIAAGAFLLLALAALLGADLTSALFGVAAPGLALGFSAATAALLVVDLKRPERFYYLLLKPNWRSWLVRGAYILMIYGALALAWLAASRLGAPALARALLWPAAIFAAAAAAYSGFLFGQAEGRDFWQSPLLPVHLLVQAVLAGSAAAALVAPALDGPGQHTRLLLALLAAGLIGHALFIAAELLMPPASTHVRLAARAMSHGPLGDLFRGLAIGGGLVLPGALLGLAAAGFLPAAPAMALAGALALAGLLAYEHCWVVAGQVPPLS